MNDKALNRIRKACQNLWIRSRADREFQARQSEPRIERARTYTAIETLGKELVEANAADIAGPDCDGSGCYIIVPQ